MSRVFHRIDIACDTLPPASRQKLEAGLYFKASAAFGLLAALTACGSTPAVGALAGGAIGAATGALTEQGDRDLGKPVYDSW